MTTFQFFLILANIYIARSMGRLGALFAGTIYLIIGCLFGLGVLGK